MKISGISYGFKCEHRWRFRLTLLIAFASMVTLFFVSRTLFIGIAQIKDQKQKQIGKATYPNEPVDVVTIGNDKVRFGMNEKFEQETEWLKGFSVKVKNNSGKSIIFFSWQLEFPETIVTGNVMGFPMYYGKHSLRKPKDYETETPIPAGNFVELTFDQKKLSRLKAFIESRHLLDSLTRADIRILEIHYDDGTGWSAGEQLRRDPKNPEKFIPTKNGQFEGN